ncbi:MAG TPA: PqqD family protein [Solirubrobacteraceae bacterium]|jgi:hypothetical protein
MEQSTEILRLKEADLVWRTVEEETVILHRGDWQYLTVNQTGTLLWTRLVDGATRADLVSVLLAEYDIDERRAAADVDAFLDLLSERDLISAAGGAQQP